MTLEALPATSQELLDTLDSVAALVPVIDNEGQRQTIENYFKSAENFIASGSITQARDVLSSALVAIKDTDAYRAIDSQIAATASAVHVDSSQVGALLGDLVGAVSDGKVSSGEAKNLATASAAIIGTAVCAASGYLTVVAPLCGLLAGFITGLIFDAASGSGATQVKVDAPTEAFYDARNKSAQRLAEVFHQFTRVYPFVDPNPWIQLPNGNWAQPSSRGAILTGAEPQKSIKPKFRPGQRLVTAADARRAAEIFNEQLATLPGPAMKTGGRDPAGPLQVTGAQGARLFVVPLDQMGRAPGTIELWVPRRWVLKAGIGGHSPYQGIEYVYPDAGLTDAVPRYDQPNATSLPPARFRELLRFVIDEPSPDGRPTSFKHAFIWATEVGSEAGAFKQLELLADGQHTFHASPTALYIKRIGYIRHYNEEGKQDDPTVKAAFLYPWLTDTFDSLDSQFMVEQVFRPWGNWVAFAKSPLHAHLLNIEVYYEEKDKKPPRVFVETTRARYEPESVNPWLGQFRSWGNVRQGSDIFETKIALPYIGNLGGSPGQVVHEKLVCEYYKDTVSAITLTLSPLLAAARAHIIAPFIEAQEQAKRERLEVQRALECWRNLQTARWVGNDVKCIPVTADNYERLMDTLVLARPADDPYKVVTEAFQRGRLTWQQQMSAPEFQRLQQISIKVAQKYMVPANREAAYASAIGIGQRIAAAAQKDYVDSVRENQKACAMEGKYYGTKPGTTYFQCRVPASEAERQMVATLRGKELGQRSALAQALQSARISAQMSQDSVRKAQQDCAAQGKYYGMKPGTTAFECRAPLSDDERAAVEKAAPTSVSPLLLVGGIAAVAAVGYFATRSK